MIFSESELEKIDIQMAAASEIMLSMTDKERFETYSDIHWMSDYYYEEVSPELKDELAFFLGVLSCYRYSFQMNGEELPKTDMPMFGDGCFSDKIVPNWVFGFLYIAQTHMEKLWSKLFCELYQYKFCLDAGLPFSKWKDGIQHPHKGDNHMIFFDKSVLN